MKKLEEAQKSASLAEKNLKSAQAQVQLLRTENQQHLEANGKQKCELEGLKQQVKMQ